MLEQNLKIPKEDTEKLQNSRKMIVIDSHDKWNEVSGLNEINYDERRSRIEVFVRELGTTYICNRQIASSCNDLVEGPFDDLH